MPDRIKKDKWPKHVDRRMIMLIITTLAVVLIMGAMNPSKFYSLYNFQSMMRQFSEIGIFSLAMFLVVISGGFTLSAIALANLSMICGGVIIQGMVLGDLFPNPAARLAAGLAVTAAVGILGGALNGYFVAGLGLTTILVTSATLMVFQGISLVITQGGSIMGAPEIILTLGAGNLFGVIPYLFILLLVCYLIVGAFLGLTSYGEQCRLLGANETANKYSGNSNFKTLMYSYMLSGFFSAVGGLVVYSRLGVLRSDYGESHTGTAMIVVLMGGAWLVGGGGRIINIFISLICLQAIATGATLAGWSPFMKNTLWGLLLLYILINGSFVFIAWRKRGVGKMLRIFGIRKGTGQVT
jgi:simple sugar transport system permease protein